MPLKEKLFQLLDRKSSRKKDFIFNARRHKSIHPPKVYNSIDDLPVWFWWEIERTGNVKLLSKKGSKSNKWKYLFYCSAVWDSMQDQHIAEFGIPSEYTDQSMARAKVAIAKAKYIVSGDNWDLMMLDIAKTELEDLRSNSKPVSNYKVKSRIESVLNIQRIDPRKTTVIEYYSLLDQAQEINRNGGRN